MTRRERIEQRLEKRREWAVKRAAESNAAVNHSMKMLEVIPVGQPILIGHHSERGHRALLKRSDNAMRRGVEAGKMANRHEQVADTLESVLDNSIFSDDPDAADALRARIAEREAQSARMRYINKAHAKFVKTGKLPDDLTEAEATMIRTYKPAYSWERHPYPPYALSNLRGRITADKKRLKAVIYRAARAAEAQAAPGGVVIKGDDYVSVTFAEKPARSILDALKAAGFHWSSGSWHGYRAKLPPDIAPPVKTIWNSDGTDGPALICPPPADSKA